MLSRGDGEFHGHAGAFARRALGGNGPAVGFDQGLYDGQAQAKTAGGAGPGRVSAIEAVEDPGQIAGGNAGAVVLKSNPRLIGS